MAGRPKGTPKTGGRVKGSHSKRTLQAEELAASLGIDPLEVLLLFIKGDWKALGYDSDVYHMETDSGSVKEGFVITPNMRLTAAKEAVKYLYAAKQSVALSTGDGGLKIIIEDYTKKND